MINNYIIGNNCLIFEKIKVDFIILNYFNKIKGRKRNKKD